MGGAFGKWSPSLFHLILFAVGGGLVYLGQEWAVPGATEIGTACIGLLMIVGGIDIILKRIAVLRAEGWVQAGIVDTYSGLAEILWGIVFFWLGALVIAVVLRMWLQPAGAGDFWKSLLDTPTATGVILATIGLMTVLNGLIRALAGSGTVNPKRWGGAALLLDRLAGALVFLFGMGLSAAAVMLLVAPVFVSTTLERIKALVFGP
jgi:hypothetical protein